MRTPWTRTEKWLWGTPLLFAVIAVALTRGPNFARRVMGWPQQLDTTSDNQLHSVVLSHDGSVLASTGQAYIPNTSKHTPSSGTVYLWDAHTFLPLTSLAPRPWNAGRGWSRGWDVDGLALSPDAKLIGINGREALGYAVYEVATQKLLWRVKTGTHQAQFSNDGRLVALGQFELRDAHTGRLISRWRTSNGSTMRRFSLSPDAKTVAWIGAKKRAMATTLQRVTAHPPKGNVVEIRRVSDGTILHTLPNSEETETVAFSPDGSRVLSLALGGVNSRVIFGSMVRCHSPSGKLLWQRDFRRTNPKTVGSNFLCDAVFSPDGKTIALRGALSGGVLLLNASDGSPQKQLAPADDQNTNSMAPPALAFSPDGKQLFARGKNSVLVWDLE